jgi:gliding motility-associated-like protein
MKNRLLLFLFLVLSAYTYGQNCAVSVSISQSAPTLCSGYDVTFSASASGGTAPYTYLWSTGETTTTITVDKAGTYTVTATDKSGKCQGTKSVTITSQTTPNAPTAPGVTVCANASATLTATDPGGTYQWYDAPSAGNFLATGATYVTPPITQSTLYYVQTTIGGCTSPRTAVGVSLVARPTVTGAIICSGDVATLIATGGTSYIWYDAPSGGNVLSKNSMYTTPALTSTTTYYVSSLSADGCESTRAPATVFVTAKPQAPTAAPVTICSGSTANLHATGGGTIFNWYSAPSGGAPLISSPDYTTPPLTTNNTYYVSDATNGCESARVPVNVTVTPLPSPPASQSDTTCYQSSITLQAGAGGAAIYQWYDAPGGKLLATGTSFTTPVLTNSTTYYLTAGNGGCFSTFSPINVIVRQQAAAPTAAGVFTCFDAPATLTATSQGGGIYQWYNAATGGKLLATGSSFTTPPLTAATTYYVQNIQSGCISARAAVNVTILPAINTPAAAGVTICSGNTAALNASGSNGGYAWYDKASGGNLLSSAQVYVTPTLNTTTIYYAEATENGCASARTPVKVTVNPTPVAPTVSGVTICPGMSAILTAAGATGVVNWLDAATGGNLLATGNKFKTPVLKVTTTYYAESISGQCMSAVVPVTVTVNPTSQFEYPGNTYCVSSPNPTPTIFNPAGGTFSAKPAGLVFVSNVTGQINIGASIPRRYIITFSGKGSCTVPETQDILITATPNASFSYSSPFCQGGANPFPTFTAASSGGAFSSSPAGLVFVNTSTGEIDLTKSTPGIYTITNTIAASGSCAAASSTASVTIGQGVNVNAGPNQTVATGTPVQLAGSISGGTTTGTWSGGTGSFSNVNSPTAIYTPGPGETNAKLTLTSTDPPGPCGPASATVTIIFTTQPAPPTAQSVTNCSGSSVTLSATAPGGSYQWYDAPTGGNLLNTGPDFITPVLMSTTTYYVQTTVNGVTSARAAVTVTVNPIPAAPVAPAVQACIGSSTILSASGSTGTYEWYDAPSGGNLLSTAASYTTPVLTANASFYVQTTVGGCISTRTQVDVTITPKPNVTSASTGTICSGQPLNYNITADLANATFIWSRASVAGISNPAVANQTSSSIAETLINTGGTSVSVTYVITASVGTCPGPSFNYVVTVYPSPTVTGPASATICNSTTDNYAITFNVPVNNLSWSRAAVPGISNQAVSGQAASVIREVLFNTTSQPINVIYVLNYSTPNCSGIPFNLVITVNPQDSVTSAAKGFACTGTPQDYAITTNIPSSTFLWSRAAVPGISNPAVSNQTPGTITETLVNTTISPVSVEYDITPIANGCPGTLFKYIATVNPELPTPAASSNSPICVGSDIHLSTAPVNNATYQWTGPNGYTSTLQNPIISNATAISTGTYTLVFTVKGCNSLPVPVQVAVDEPPVANAGPDQVVCIKAPETMLDGTITGGTSTGVWSTAGTGTFVPSANTLNAHYIPSAADTAAGSVKLTLTSTSKDNCTISSSSMMIIFGPVPAVHAGPDQSVCSQNTSVALAGSISIPGGGTWATAGTGTFSSQVSQLVNNYLPSAADVQNGSVMLTLTANNAGVCYIPTDTVIITFVPPPTVYAGGTRYILDGSTITLFPTVSDNNVHYQWSPDININNDTLKNPVITGGKTDQVYKLTVTDSRGCVAQDTALIKVAPTIKINNTFTPNGDGINDYWDIVGLIAYQDATVDIFDRWGRPVFHSLGYPKPWDGTYGGKPVAVGVYYYVINTHYEGQVFSGYVTVIR